MRTPQLALLDALVATVAIAASSALVLHVHPAAGVGVLDAPLLTSSTIGAAVLGAYMAGLDEPKVILRPRDLALRVPLVAILAAAVGTLVTQFTSMWFPGRIEFGLRAAALAGGMIGWRLLLARHLRSRPRRPVVVLGTGRSALRVADLINQTEHARHVVVGFVGDRPPERHEPEVDVPYLGHPGRAVGYCLEHGVRDLVVCTNGETPRWFRTLGDLRAHGVQVTTAAALAMESTGRMPLDAVCSAYLLGSFEQISKPGVDAIKRVLDVSVSLLGLSLFGVLLPLLYAVVKLDSPGQFFYSQERVGLAGRIFRVHKIRTMTTAPRGARQRWASASDARVTRVGRFLRKSRIDELPQFWNVLKGEMSVVGPRPEQPALARKIERRLPAFAYRTLVKPGITGWAQIHHGYADSLEDTAVKLSFDLYYVRHYGPALDLGIMLRTAMVMISGAGAR